MTGQRGKDGVTVTEMRTSGLVTQAAGVEGNELQYMIQFVTSHKQITVAY